MRYLRLYIGDESGAPGLTLYEIDHRNKVHRLAQLQEDSTRFSPENVLMRASVNADYMVRHPACEEIDEIEFSKAWARVRDQRSLCLMMPDAQASWSSSVALPGGENVSVRWVPGGQKPGTMWVRVPGFDRLFALTREAAVAWRVYNHIFISGGDDLFSIGKLRR